MDLKKLASEHIYTKAPMDLTLEGIYNLVETPKSNTYGDVAFPCFALAKKMKKSPTQIASDLVSKLKGEMFEKVESVGPYINFFYKKSFVANQVINEVIDCGDHYGDLKIGSGENITIDWSSPNIAKPFSLGHLRSTVIGNSLGLIADKCGYHAIKINHLGDWGTQFGKMIVAYKGWGSEEKVRANPIEELLKLYVEFHEKAEHDKELEQQGRDWFKKLEDGDEEATKLWKWFSAESLKEFEKIYNLLEMKADFNHCESFYVDKTDEIIEILKEKNLLIEDNGALVVKLDDENLPIYLIKKSDGATLYSARDLAAALYRKRTFNFAKNIYVFGGEQRLHFKQFVAVLEKMGFDWTNEMYHTPFGMVRQDGKKLSTRKGKVVLLEVVLKESIKMAEKAISEKNPNLVNKEIVAKEVGVGAVIFHDLRNERVNDIDFNLESMLKFEGDTGPYIQYTNVRANSILRKVRNVTVCREIKLDDPFSFEMVKIIAEFPKVIEKAFSKLEPSVISKYLINLAQSFNTYYGHVHILENDEQLDSRLALVKATSIVLTEGLRILGISAPKEM